MPAGQGKAQDVATGGSTTSPIDQHHARTVFKWTVAHRIAALLLLLAAAHLQRPFDSSPLIQLMLDGNYANGSSHWKKKMASYLIRWDSLHFLVVASPRPLPRSDIYPHSLYALESGSAASGLTLEHSLAWQPGIVWLLRGSGYITSLGQGHESRDWDPASAVLFVSALATIASCFSPLLLYRLTKALTRNTRLSYITALLSIWSTSPATLITPTPEPFYSLFALLGSVALAETSSCQTAVKSKHARRGIAAAFFILATAFRANGILLSGFLVWHVITDKVRPSSWPRSIERLGTTMCALAYAVICSLPLLLYQIWAYTRFCNGNNQRPWCQRPIPSAYTFVQSHYWEVGPFRYWTLSQLPNWLLAASVLGATGYWLVTYVSSAPRLIGRRTLAMLVRGDDQAASPAHGAPSLCAARHLPGMLPHVYFTAATLALLVVSSHIQIALRFASPGGLPAAWWGAASLLVNMEGRVRLVVQTHVIRYLVLWNVASIILYAGFYPPA